MAIGVVAGYHLLRTFVPSVGYDESFERDFAPMWLGLWRSDAAAKLENVDGDGI